MVPIITEFPGGNILSRTGKLAVLSCALAAIAVLAVALSPAVLAGMEGDTVESGTWTASVIDPSGHGATNPAIVSDASGSLYVAYYDETDQDLKFAYRAWDSDAWSLEVVDSAGMVGRDCGIALDNYGGVHISYYDETNHDLKCADRPAGGGAWALTTVDSAGDVGMRTGIAVDGSNLIHITYLDYTSADIKRATHSASQGGSWSNETVFSGNVGTGSIALAIDGLDVLHVAFIDGLNNDLMYMYKHACCNFSAPEPVDTEGSVGWQVSICIGAANEVEVAYQNADNYGLKHASKPAGGLWSNETVLTGANGETCIQADKSPAGTGIYISYYQNSGGDVGIARYPPAGPSWETDNIDPTNDTGAQSSMAIDGSGAAHIVYTDSNAGTLKYATNKAEAVPEVAAALGIFAALGMAAAAGLAYAACRRGWE